MGAAMCWFQEGDVPRGHAPDEGERSRPPSARTGPGARRLEPIEKTISSPEMSRAAAIVVEGVGTHTGG